MSWNETLEVLWLVGKTHGQTAMVAGRKTLVDEGLCRQLKGITLYVGKRETNSSAHTFYLVIWSR